MFQLQPKTYNWMYLLRLPFECQPVCTIIVVLQKLITGLVNVLWILVQASFIDTALRVAQGQAGIEAAIPWLIYMILIIIWKRMGYNLGRVATRKLEIEAEAQMTTEAVKKRSRLHYSLIEDKESWELVNRVSGQIAKNTWYMLQWTCNFLNAAVKIIGTFLILFTRLWWMRLAIARGLYRNHQLIVLDEPTASIDPLEESAIYQKFAEMSRGKTAVIITHRLGSARIADRILVLDHGELVESGTHTELLAAKGQYSRLYEAQAKWYTD